MPRSWKRKEEHDDELSFADFFALSDEALTLLTQAGADTSPWFNADFKTGGEVTSTDPAEFKSDLDGVARDELSSLIFSHGDSALGVRLRSFTFMRPQTSVAVQGSNRTQVEGIFVQINEAVVKRLRTPTVTDGAEYVNVPDDKSPSDPVSPAAVESAPAEPASTEPASTESRRSDAASHWRHNAWTVEIVGGIVAAVVAAVILALVLGID